MATKTMPRVEKPIRGSYKQQLANIANDDANLDSKKVLQKEKRLSEISLWFERSEEKLVDIKVNQQREVVKKELKLADQAFKKVRKEAMKRLIEREIDKYNVELQAEDKTFFTQRM